MILEFINILAARGKNILVFWPNLMIFWYNIKFCINVFFFKVQSQICIRMVVFSCFKKNYMPHFFLNAWFIFFGQLFNWPTMSSSFFYFLPIWAFYEDCSSCLWSYLYNKEKDKSLTKPKSNSTFILIVFLNLLK